MELGSPPAELAIVGLDACRSGGLNYSGLYFSMFVHGLYKEESWHL